MYLDHLYLDPNESLSDLLNVLNNHLASKISGNYFQM